MEMTTTNSNDILVFVYGTLKSGGRLNGAMIRIGGTCCGEAKILTKDYVMRSLGSYPALVPVASGTGTYITGELWVIPKAGVAVLDKIEGYPGFYDRKQITAWSGQNSFKALAYYIDFGNSDDNHKSYIVRKPIVESGEWDAIANCPVSNGNNDTDESNDMRGSIEHDTREDCSECGYWMLPDGDDPEVMVCNNCGARHENRISVGYDSGVPWEDEEDPRFQNSDFTVDNGVYIINESGESYGPYEDIKTACAKIADVANEYGHQVRALHVGFRVYCNSLSNDELADLEADTQLV